MGLVATVAVALLACDVSRGTKSHHAEQLRLDVRAQTKKNKGNGQKKKEDPPKPKKPAPAPEPEPEPDVVVLPEETESVL